MEKSLHETLRTADEGVDWKISLKIYYFFYQLRIRVYYEMFIRLVMMDIYYFTTIFEFLNF